jgi:hypothetical protein
MWKNSRVRKPLAVGTRESMGMGLGYATITTRPYSNTFNANSMRSCFVTTVLEFDIKEKQLKFGILRIAQGRSYASTS